MILPQFKHLFYIVASIVYELSSLKFLWHIRTCNLWFISHKKINNDEVVFGIIRDGVGGRGPGCSGSCCVKPGPLKHGLASAPQLRYGSYGGERPSSSGAHLHAGKQAKWQKRQKRQMRLNAEANKESVRVTETYFIPRTELPIPKDGVRFPTHDA
jgi:hypothetical protein